MAPWDLRERMTLSDYRQAKRAVYAISGGGARHTGEEVAR